MTTATARKSTLTVVTDLGTFTRTTTRAYTHIVTVSCNDQQGNPDGRAAGVLAYCGSLALAQARAHEARGIRFGYKRPTAPLVYRDVRIYAVTGERVQ